jgi:hypothetical protein
MLNFVDADDIKIKNKYFATVEVFYKSILRNHQQASPAS